MLGNVNRLAVPDPRQHLAGVVAQVPEAHRMRLRGHSTNVSQFCGYSPLKGS